MPGAYEHDNKPSVSQNCEKYLDQLSADPYFKYDCALWRWKFSATPTLSEEQMPSTVSQVHFVAERTVDSVRYRVLHNTNLRLPFRTFAVIDHQ
jgi:hypothetical protein